MVKKFPDKIKQEIRNLVALQSRELVMQAKASGANQGCQEKIMEKGFHGSENHQSLMTLFFDGKSPYNECFESTDMDNNRPGNENRSGGKQLELKPILHLQWDAKHVIGENGFVRDELVVNRRSLMSGRNINERAMTVIANHRKGVAYAKEFLKDDGSFPSGKNHEDMLRYVREKMFVLLKGKMQQEHVKPDAPEVKEEDMPEEYFFTGYMAFVVFGPHGLSKQELSCMSECKKVKPKGRAAIRREEALQKEKERQSGTGGHVPSEYVRGAPLQAKATIAHISQKEDSDRRQHVLGLLHVANGDHKEIREDLKEIREQIRELEENSDDNSETRADIKALKAQRREINASLSNLRKRKIELQKEADKWMRAPVRRQVTAFEEQVGDFTNTSSSNTSTVSALTGVSTTPSNSKTPSQDSDDEDSPMVGGRMVGHTPEDVPEESHENSRDRNDDDENSRDRNDDDDDDDNSSDS